MNIRLYNARILTMEDFNIIHGELWVSDGKIIRVGDNIIDNYMMAWDEEIDCENNLLMPGFKNAHAHAPMTFLRSYADDLPLQEWLYNKVFPAEAKLDADDIYHLSKVAILEYLTSGITSSFEMYYHPESISKASTELGYRTVLCSSAIGDIGANRYNLYKLEEEYVKYNDYNPLISYKLGFHGEYTTSREFIESIGVLSNKYKAPVYMHSQETANEIKTCIDKYNISPTKLFEECGLFEYGGGCFHMVYSDEEDINILKKHNISVVTNPASNMKLASGIAPISKYVDNEINVAIGTDGPASNNCLDMFREMFLVTGLQKLLHKDAASMSAENVLKMATVNGSIAMGLNKCDTLSLYKTADIIMIDLNRPNMQPINNIVKNIVYSGSKDNIKMTMINGQILYRDGKFANHIKEKYIYENANKVTIKILC